MQIFRRISRRSIVFLIMSTTALGAIPSANADVADRYLTKLFEAKSYDALSDANRFVRTNAAEKDIRIIANRLVSQLNSSKILEFELDSTIVIPKKRNRFAFESTTISGSLGPRDSNSRYKWKSPHDPSYTIQDIGYVGGRAAWALEQIFGLYLPAIQRNYPKSEIVRRSKIIRRHIFDEWDRRLQLARIHQLAAEERARIARDYPHHRTPELLAYDPNIDVRLAVAESLWTPTSVAVALLQREPKPDPNSSERKRWSAIRRAVKLNQQNLNIRDHIATLQTYYAQVFPDLAASPLKANSKIVLKEHQESEPTPKASPSVQRLLNPIYASASFSELKSAISNIRDSVSVDELDELASSLVARVSSRELLAFDVSVRSDDEFPFESTTVKGSLIDLRIRTLVTCKGWDGHNATYTTQDVGYTGGRSAWALEQIFGVYLPAIQRSHPPEEIEKRVEEIRQIVSDEWKDRVKIARISQLPISERVAIAKTCRHSRTLHCLAKDPALEVQVAVVTNDWATIYTLWYLQDTLALDQVLKTLPKGRPQFKTKFLYEAVRNNFRRVVQIHAEYRNRLRAGT